MSLAEKIGLWFMAIGANLYLRGSATRRQEKADRFMEAYNGELLECSDVYAGGHGYHENRMKDAHWSADIVLGMLRHSDVKLDTDRPLTEYELQAKE